MSEAVTVPFLMEVGKAQDFIPMATDADLHC